ncbi:MAG: HEPN domain-containing protein [Prochlorotrichaceae cyanobacterium]|jgi:hypothetical protein
MVVTPDLSNASQEFKRLANAIDLLKAELLPENLEDDQFPDDLSQSSTQVKAFIALSHAEIEAYIENMAIQILTQAIENLWKSHKRVSIPVLALMIFFPQRKDNDILKFKRDIQRNKLRTYIDDEIQRVNDTFRQRVKDNHGIREANLYSLLLPLGLEIDIFDNLWIQEIETLANERGTIVHQSRYGTLQPFNPKDKFEQVYKILYGRDLENQKIFKGLIDIDEDLRSLCL